jgi:hypothetical protein
MHLQPMFGELRWYPSTSCPSDSVDSQDEFLSGLQLGAGF